MFIPADEDFGKKREAYAHFLTETPCTFSMTVKLDITSLRERKIRLTPALLYALSAAVNAHEEFRMSIENGVLGHFDEMWPEYTVFHEEDESFSCVWTEYRKDFAEFCEKYAEDMKLYGKICRRNAKPGAPEHLFSVSVIPWESFSGFHLHLQNGWDYLRPIFTAGRFYEEGGRTQLPLAVQVHHAVCDGFHVCRFVQDVRRILSQL